MGGFTIIVAAEVKPGDPVYVDYQITCSGGHRGDYINARAFTSGESMYFWSMMNGGKGFECKYDRVFRLCTSFWNRYKKK